MAIGFILGMVVLAAVFWFWSASKTSPHNSDSEVPEYKKTERQVDAILQKVSEKGMASLTEEEKKILLATSEKYQRRAESKKAESKLSI